MSTPLAKSGSQIVHESEAQRQFPRIQLPARVEVGLTHCTGAYAVRDLSSAGLGIRDIEIPCKTGDTFPLKLILPFDDFELDINLTGQLQHYDKKLGLAGCRFVNLTPGQISTLNHVIRSFIAGDIVATEDLLHVISRDNFVKMRGGAKPSATKSLADKLKEIGTYTLITVATIGLFVFILGNLYERIFLLKTGHALVVSDVHELRAPAAGILTLTIAPGRATVKKGEVLAKITGAPLTPGGIRPGASTPLTSPCDCFIAGRHLEPGQYSAQGARLFTLLPAQTPPRVEASVPLSKIHRIPIGTRATMKIPGMPLKIPGEVTDIKGTSPAWQTGGRSTGTAGTTPDTAASASAAAGEPTGTVVVTPTAVLPLDHIGRPVFVEFAL